MDKALAGLLQDCLSFLSLGGHEIVNVEQPDYSQDILFYGFSLGWEQERDQLIQRLETFLSQGKSPL